MCGCLKLLDTSHHLTVFQAVWIQDLRASIDPSFSKNPKDADDFASVLIRALDAVNVRPALASMLKCDVCLLKIIIRYCTDSIISTQIYLSAH